MVGSCSINGSAVERFRCPGRTSHEARVLKARSLTTAATGRHGLRAGVAGVAGRVGGLIRSLAQAGEIDTMALAADVERFARGPVKPALGSTI